MDPEQSFENLHAIFHRPIGLVLVCDRLGRETPPSCEGGEGVQGALTLFCGGVAQTCHDDRVVELKEQLGVEEVDGERQEGKVKEEGRGRVKENAPRMTWR